MRNIETIERLSIPEPNSGCRLWEGSVNRDGYGRVGKRDLAHRAAWKAYYGKIPEGLQVLHKCDVPCCVEPTHLWLGTHTDNMRDCAKKGRIFMHLHPELSPLCGCRVRRPRGERHSQARLSESQINEIRETYAAGAATQQELAIRFGIARSHVSRIVNRVRWRG